MSTHVLETLCGCVGLSGFTAGLLARTLTIATGAAIQWYIYETVKEQLSQSFV